jgi:Domain of unknown function (DUF2017)
LRLRRAGRSIQIRLSGEEAAALRNLADELRSLLESENRDDPVEGRLFPDAYESPEEAKEYRAMVEDELREARLSSLAGVQAALGSAGRVDTVLGPEQVDAWLTVLTDLRLAIGTRLEVTEESMSEEVDPADPRGPTMSMLHWLGWVQESLLEEIQENG